MFAYARCLQEKEAAVTLSLAAAAPSVRVRTPYLTASRRDRRRLIRCDLDAAHLAELHHIRAIVTGAVAVVRSGWIQHGWFEYQDDRGRRRTASAQTLRVIADRPITGACLVGAIVQAAGGVSSARTQPVRRALDLTWHTLYRGEDEPVGWCPAPAIRLARVHDLTQWNDAADRTDGEVSDLLVAAEERAGREMDRMQVRTS